VALRQHVERHGLGEVLWDVDLLFQPHQFLRPDIVYVPPAGLGGITDRGVESVPGLVIEVLSPHSGTIDRVKKPPRYRDFDVPEYWVVDPASRAIEVYRFSAGRVAPVVHDGTFSWKALPDAPPLELDVAVIFPAP
jgi:Uma2 family endonuclease